jgi:hypothetical protein
VANQPAVVLGQLGAQRGGDVFVEEVTDLGQSRLLRGVQLEIHEGRA